MNKTNDTQVKIEKLSKLNTYLLSGAVFSMFSYVILLGLTASNVVALRSTTKLVEDSKTELGGAELGYMSIDNVISLENDSDVDFDEAVNVAYVSVNNTANADSVAIATNGN